MMSTTVHPHFVPGIKTPEWTSLARWYLYQDERLVLDERTGSLALPLARDVCALGIAPVRTQYLGRLTDAEPIECFSGEIDSNATLPQGYSTHELRSLFEIFPDYEIALAGRAKQIAHWDRDHQYCGRCATPTASLESERARRCPACGLTSYPRISPAIIVAVTRQSDDGARILLARNHRFPAGRYSVVAGFVEPGETLEDCVRREVAEETGIAVDNIRYFSSQPWPFPNSLMVGFTAEYAGGDFAFEADEIADAQWFAAHALPLMPPKISIARQLIDAFVAQHTGSDTAAHTG